MKELFLLYIDPGSGSLLVQIIIGAIVAGGLFFKNIWYKIYSFFKRKDS